MTLLECTLTVRSQQRVVFTTAVPSDRRVMGSISSSLHRTIHHPTLQVQLAWQHDPLARGVTLSDVPGSGLVKEVTTLQYEDKLPDSVIGINRKELLRLCHLWKGGHHEPKELHEVIEWKPGDPALVPAEVAVEKWELVCTDNQREKN
ncbi:hypothetical protein B0H14DRAFT_2586322 [Mycena olivaceomarginata]|nr:hypothetical protein B0H14DRAFT_2586322 [Mycena olivaceomarginata]